MRYGLPTVTISYLFSISAIGIPNLTKKEKEILKLIAEGFITSQMAEKLYISPLTVETHRRNLMHKFEVNNAAALIGVAKDYGLI